jgi:polyisoprenoid-binding protein YceI
MTSFSVVSHRSRVAVEVLSTLQRLELTTEQLTGEFQGEFRDGRIAPGAVAWLSLPTMSLESGNWLIDRDVRSMFEARKFPEIGGELIEIKSTEEGDDYGLRGNLSLHGVTREVAGRATVVEIGENHVVFEGSMRLDYTLFNLAPPKLLMLRVQPEVTISGCVYAERRP